MVPFCFWSVQQRVCAGNAWMFLADFDSLFVSVAVTVHTQLETFVLTVGWSALVCAAFSLLGPWTFICTTPKKMMENVLFYFKMNNQIGCKGDMVGVCVWMSENKLNSRRVWIETEEAIRLIFLLSPRKESHHVELKAGLKSACEVTAWTAELQSILGLSFP